MIDMSAAIRLMLHRGNRTATKEHESTRPRLRDKMHRSRIFDLLHAALAERVLTFMGAKVNSNENKTEQT